jgi:hypothetical protein
MSPLPGGPPQGGPPPGFPRPVQASHPGAGTQGGGLIKLSQAIHLIQAALAELPIGSEMHKAALKAAQDLSKHVPGAQEMQGVNQTGAQGLIQNIIRGALMNKVGGNQGGPPAMPPMTPIPGA